MSSLRIPRRATSQKSRFLKTRGSLNPVTEYCDFVLPRKFLLFGPKGFPGMHQEGGDVSLLQLPLGLALHTEHSNGNAAISIPLSCIPSMLLSCSSDQIENTEVILLSS